MTEQDLASLPGFKGISARSRMRRQKYISKYGFSYDISENLTAMTLMPLFGYMFHYCGVHDGFMELWYVMEQSGAVESAQNVVEGVGEAVEGAVEEDLYPRRSKYGVGLTGGWKYGVAHFGGFLGRHPIVLNCVTSFVASSYLCRVLNMFTIPFWALGRAEKKFRV